MNKLKVVFVVLLLLGAAKLYGQTASPQSSEGEVSVDTGNGFGSSGSATMTFANVDANVGGALPYTPSAVNGDLFTINTDGVYGISYSDGNASGSGDIIGITLNGSASTGIGFQSAGNRLCMVSMLASQNSSCSVTIQLSRGDVVRAQRHLSTAGSGSNGAARFVIVRIH